MAVQQNRKTRSKRGMRRSHDRIKLPTFATDSETGEQHRRHHITASGFYRGKQVVQPKIKAMKQDASVEHEAGA